MEQAWKELETDRKLVVYRLTYLERHIGWSLGSPCSESWSPQVLARILRLSYRTFLRQHRTYSWLHYHPGWSSSQVWQLVVWDELDALNWPQNLMMIMIRRVMSCWNTHRGHSKCLSVLYAAKEAAEVSHSISQINHPPPSETHSSMLHEAENGGFHEWLEGAVSLVFLTDWLLKTCPCLRTSPEGSKHASTKLNTLPGMIFTWISEAGVSEDVMSKLHAFCGMEVDGVALAVAEEGLELEGGEHWLTVHVLWALASVNCWGRRG